MFKFLNHKLEELTANKFRVIAPLVSFTSDLLLVYYMKAVISERINDGNLINNVLKLQGIDPSMLGQEEVMMVKNLMESSLNLGLGLIIIIHTVIYIFCIRNKHWAKNYVKGYAFLASFLTIFEIAAMLYQFGSVSWITPTTMVAYFLVYYGYHYFMKKEEL